MTDLCSACGVDIGYLDYTCSYCGDVYCVEHRLPEHHDCFGLKIEKAVRDLDAKPWFKDEFRLSNVDESELPELSDESDEEIVNDVQDVVEREENINLVELTRQIQEQRKTRRDELREQRREKYSSPDMNLDGTLKEANYEDDIKRIRREPEEVAQGDQSTLFWSTWYLILIFVASILVYYFVWL